MATATLKIGDACPDFRLPATNGNTYSLGDFTGDVLVIVFSCNHCPYVIAKEAAMNAFARDYAPEGVDFVAINSNETTLYPEDTFDNMVVRAKERGFVFPYLRDEDQSVARSFDAACTPECFVFDAERKLRYHGRFDGSGKEASLADGKDLRQAVDSLLAGQDPSPAETPAIGCSIKWAASD